MSRGVQVRVLFWAQVLFLGKVFAEIAQLVEHNLAKVGVASSSLVFRSKKEASYILYEASFLFEHEIIYSFFSEKPIIIPSYPLANEPIALNVELLLSDVRFVINFNSISALKSKSIVEDVQFILVFIFISFINFRLVICVELLYEYVPLSFLPFTEA